MKTYISSPGSTNGLAEHPQRFKMMYKQKQIVKTKQKPVYVAVFVVVKKWDHSLALSVIYIQQWITNSNYNLVSAPVELTSI